MEIKPMLIKQQIEQLNQASKATSPYQSLQILLEKDFPSTTVNNSRSIVRNLVKKAKKYSFNIHHQIESMTGWDIDSRPSDMGIEPEPLKED